MVRVSRVWYRVKDRDRVKVRVGYALDSPAQRWPAERLNAINVWPKMPTINHRLLQLAC